MTSAPPYPPQVGKLTDDQIATRATWGGVPDADMAKAAAHTVNVVPTPRGTITLVNELDPGIPGETVGENEGNGWKCPPRSYGPVAVHGRGIV